MRLHKVGIGCDVAGDVDEWGTRGVKLHQKSLGM